MAKAQQSGPVRPSSLTRRPIADLGVGIAYGVGKSGLSVFVQGTGFFYSLTELTSPAL